MIYRLGMLIPSANIATEIDMNRVLPKNYQVHFARLRVDSVDEEGWHQLNSDINYQAELLSSIKPSAMIILQTSASFYGDADYDNKLMKRIEKISGVQTFSTAYLFGQALKALNAQKITILSPYSTDLLGRGQDYFERIHGLDIIDAQSFNMTDPDVIGKLTSDPARKALEKQAEFKPDAMLIAGGAYQIMGHVSKWEEEFGIPILTTNQVAAWGCVQAVKGLEKINGYGYLLEKMPKYPSLK
jgi:maleate isomerase